MRIRVDGLKDPETRQKYSERVAAAVARVRACSDIDGPFKRLSLMQQASVLAAKKTLGTSGCDIRPLVPRYSEAFRKTAAHIRLLKVVRRELLARRAEVHPLPASRAMAKLLVWHACPEAFPEGAVFRALDNLAGEAGWSRLAVGGLRVRIHNAEEELRLLRRPELSEASEKQRRAAIDGFWNGGGLCRFLHPPSPALHSAALRCEVVTSLTITEVQPSLARTLHGSGTNISHDGQERFKVRLASSSQLGGVLTAMEKEGAKVTLKRIPGLTDWWCCSCCKSRPPWWRNMSTIACRSRLRAYGEFQEEQLCGDPSRERT